MKFVLTINCDNAAFGESAEDAEIEVARLLMEVAMHIRRGAFRNTIGRTMYRSLFDHNGNNCGQGSFTYDATEDRRE